MEFLKKIKKNSIPPHMGGNCIDTQYQAWDNMNMGMATTTQYRTQHENPAKVP
jgi:hypothetical protein